MRAGGGSPPSSAQPSLQGDGTHWSSKRGTLRGARAPFPTRKPQAAEMADTEPPPLASGARPGRGGQAPGSPSAPPRSSPRYSGPGSESRSGLSILSPPLPDGFRPFPRLPTLRARRCSSAGPGWERAPPPPPFRAPQRSAGGSSPHRLQRGHGGHPAPARRSAPAWG